MLKDAVSLPRANLHYLLRRTIERGDELYFTVLAKRLLECWKKLQWANKAWCSHEAGVTGIRPHLSESQKFVSESSATTPTRSICQRCWETNLVTKKRWCVTNKLVTKLKLYGIGEPLLSWFYSYLVGREQRVVVNGTCSTWTEAGSGVPQGSILGPILFLLFVNDMPNVVSSARIAMFADDSKCYKIIEQASDFVNLQQDLDALLDWSLSNEIYFQPAKCKNVRISRKRVSPPRTYNLNGFDLEVVKSEKDLGVIIANDTSWKEHIVMIVAKVNRVLGFLKRHCAGLVDSEALLRLYSSLVRSHLCYCSQVWAPQSVVSQLTLIEQVQRRATRFIVGKGRELSYRDRLIKLKLLPLNYWLEYLDLVFFFKCMKGDIIFARHFDEYFSFLRGWSRRTSSELCLKINRARTSHFRDYFFNRITILWNSIPDDIKLATSLDSFKRKLKSLFFWRLHYVFSGDNIRSYKIICPKCRRVNLRTACSC